MKAVAVSLTLLTLLVGGARTAMAQAPDGQALYRQHCVSCHGATGVPAPAMAKALGVPTFDAALVKQVSQDSMLAMVTNGDGKNMKSFKDKLSAEQRAAVIQYIRGTFGK